MMNKKCALDILNLWYFTRLNPFAKTKDLNEQMFQEQPDEQLRKGSFIHRIDVDKHQNIGFGFAMLFGYIHI